MPTTRSQAKRSRLPDIGQRVGINRLPPEILSAIFVACDRIWRHHEEPGWDKSKCRAILSTICSYWRKVAIDTTALWTRIVLSLYPPWHFTKICLTRAGPTALLDIELNMEIDIYCDTESNEEKNLDRLVGTAEDALAFIANYGGGPSRWRTLSSKTNVFLVQLAVMKLFGKYLSPSLTSVEMQRRGTFEFGYDDQYRLNSEVKSEPKMLFREPPLVLRSIKLRGVPGTYLFGHSRPQFVALTHLELCFEIFHPKLADFHKLLAANPRLETIRLSSRSTFDPVIIDEGRLPSIYLPQLRSLSFILVASSWTLRTIMMLDVSNVTSLELILGVVSFQDRLGEEAGIRELLAHIIGDENQAPPTPCFSSLKSLTLASEMTPDFEDDLTAVLASHPQITELTLPSCPSFGPLLRRPWQAPDIEYLRVGSNDLAQLKEVVNSRRKAGLPLRTVRVGRFARVANGWQSDRKYDLFACM
ncbi:hypothetical protein B0J17DRAFT_659864 [Rhizoctonia solani]|nr:hypothetical protein B0J17DRAFT_659864 [Rhizoctonia solani]